jgi:hypothetical protein
LCKFKHLSGPHYLTLLDLLHHEARPLRPSSGWTDGLAVKQNNRIYSEATEPVRTEVQDYLKVGPVAHLATDQVKAQQFAIQSVLRWILVEKSSRAAQGLPALRPWRLLMPRHAHNGLRRFVWTETYVHRIGARNQSIAVRNRCDELHLH